MTENICHKEKICSVYNEKHDTCMDDLLCPFGGYDSGMCTFNPVSGKTPYHDCNIRKLSLDKMALDDV